MAPAPYRQTACADANERPEGRINALERGLDASEAGLDAGA